MSRSVNYANSLPNLNYDRLNKLRKTIEQNQKRFQYHHIFTYTNGRGNLDITSILTREPSFQDYIHSNNVSAVVTIRQLERYPIDIPEDLKKTLEQAIQEATHDCNTLCCVAGFACLNKINEATTFQGKRDALLSIDGSAFDEASDYLSLIPTEAAFLFAPTNDEKEEILRKIFQETHWFLRTDASIRRDSTLQEVLRRTEYLLEYRYLGDIEYQHCSNVVGYHEALRRISYLLEYANY
jgi:hypothetical protein